MPPRSRKRKAYGVRARSFKRRRGLNRVSFRSRSRSRPRRRRTGRFKRRFKRKLRSRRLNRRKISPSLQRHRLEFKITEPREVQRSYGQQHSVPNANVEVECIYFATELYDTAVVTNRDAVQNRLLGGIEDIMEIANYAFLGSAANVSPSVGQTWTYDNVWGKLFIKGQDTYTIRNQSNETIQLTAYVCRCRKDTLRYNGSLRESLIWYLGQGFSENGYDVANAAWNNAAVTLDNMNPRQSRLFCRTFKITNQFKVTIPAGASANRKIHYKWHKHTPADYIQTSNATSAWSAKTRRYGHIKGEKFILWKLHAPIGGIAGQTDVTRKITQTTPTVIMKTERHYSYKHFPRPLGGVFTLTASGIDTGTASIIIDDDEKVGAETDAS